MLIVRSKGEKTFWLLSTIQEKHVEAKKIPSPSDVQYLEPLDL